MGLISHALPGPRHVGSVVRLVAAVSDFDGEPIDAASVTLTVQPESGGVVDVSAAITHPGVGAYEASYALAVAARHLVTWTTTGDHAGVTTVVVDVDPPDLAFLTVAQLRSDYLGDISATDTEITSALRAERAAQAGRCRIDPYTYELREALMRRVARNLAARSVPVATWTSFEGGATGTRVPNTDAEIRRLEAPYRKLVIG